MDRKQAGIGSVERDWMKNWDRIRCESAKEDIFAKFLVLKHLINFVATEKFKSNSLIMKFNFPHQI